MTPKIIGGKHRYEMESSEFDSFSNEDNGDETESDYEEGNATYQEIAKPTKSLSSGSSSSTATVQALKPAVDLAKPQNSTSLHSRQARPLPTRKDSNYDADTTSRSATQISMIGDLSYRHSKSCLVHLLSDRYSVNLGKAKVLDELYDDESDKEYVNPDMSMHIGNNLGRGLKVNHGILSWDTLTDINLSHGNLESLIDLDTICPHLVRLDVSYNKLDIILGIPSSVRVLDLSHNKLTNMATVGGLKTLLVYKFLTFLIINK